MKQHSTSSSHSSASSANQLLLLALAVKAKRMRARQLGLPDLQPHQVPPAGDWRGWLFLAGRGAGKTFAGAHWLLSQNVQYRRIIAPTYSAARDTCVEGPAGIKTIAPDLIANWNRSLGEVKLKDGSEIKLFSAQEPDRLRGPQSHADWWDETAAWDYGIETVDQALLGLRLGDNPRYVVTTTPRPTALVRQMLADETIAVTRATTFDNIYLPEVFRETILARYEGTTLGRQEIYAEIIAGNDGVFQRVRDAATAEVQDQARDGHVYCIGVDWGRQNDRTVVVVYDITLQAAVHVASFSRMDYARQQDRITEIARRFGYPTLYVERNSIGGPMLEALTRAGLPARGFDTTAQSKPVIIESLALAFEQQRIRIVPDETLISELEAYEAETTRSGAIVYNAPSGLHDDHVIALAIAYHHAGRTSSAVGAFG